MNNCDLCGKEGLTEFTVKSKHLRWILSEDLQKLDTHKNNWLTKNICEDCFKKIFGKQEENYTIEQNAEVNRIGSGVLSVSGYVSEKHTCKECVGEKEKRFRPFNNCDELIEHFVAISGCMNGVSFRPLIWVKHKEYGTEFLITSFDNRKDLGNARLPCVCIQEMWVDFEELLEGYTFLDDSPVGKLEEQIGTCDRLHYRLCYHTYIDVYWYLDLEE